MRRRISRRLALPAANAGSKITEKSVEAEVKLHPEYIKVVVAYNEADAMLDMIKAALEAFKQRRDMLIQLGASQREEMKGELRMGSVSHHDAVLSRIKEMAKERAATPA
jgi:predicted CoA-binding protein